MRNFKSAKHVHLFQGRKTLHSEEPQIHGMAWRVQPVGHASLDVSGNPAVARQAEGQQPGLTPSNLLRAVRICQ